MSEQDKQQHELHQQQSIDKLKDSTVVEQQQPSPQSTTTTTTAAAADDQHHTFLISYHKIEEYLKNWAHDVTLKWRERLQQLKDILQKYSQPNIMIDIPLTIDDLDEDSLYPHNTVEGDRLLNTYTIAELKEYLNRFKIIPALEAKGYKRIQVVPDFSDSFVHRIKITDESLCLSGDYGPNNLLLDCFVRRKDIYLSDIESDIKNGGSNISSDISDRIQVTSTTSPTTTTPNPTQNSIEQQQYYQWRGQDNDNSLTIISTLINFPIKASVIEWLSLQDPHQTFTNSRPPLPSQRFPGLGIAKQMDDLFVFMASKSSRDCLLNTPYRFYNAFMYQAREYFFIDPKQQSFFLTLLNDLEPAIVKFGLSPVAWAFEFGCVKEIETNLPVKWEFHKQARPISQRMKQYFLSEPYNTYVRRKFIGGNHETPPNYLKNDGGFALLLFKQKQIDERKVININLQREKLKEKEDLDLRIFYIVCIDVELVAVNNIDDGDDDDDQLIIDINYYSEINEDVYPAGDLELKVKTWEMLSKGESFCFLQIPLSPITNEIRSNMTMSSSSSSSSNTTTNTTTTTATTIDTPPLISTSSTSSALTLSTSMSTIRKSFVLKNKKGEDTNSELTITFELIPDQETTSLKSIPLLFRWFPDLPHIETVMSEFYCTKESKKTISMSHNGTISPSHLAKNKKTMIHFKDILKIKKKIGSFYLPNAIEVRTTQKRYLFASFIHRSKAFSILINQWNVHGGPANLGDANNQPEEDDDEVDDTELISINQQQQDPRIQSLANSGSQRPISPLRHIQSIYPNNGPLDSIMDLNNSTSSTSSFSSSLSNSGSSTTTTSKRRLSNSPSVITNSSSNSSSKLITPPNSSSPLTIGVTDDNNKNVVKLVVDIEDYEQFGCNNTFSVNILVDSTVGEFLNKLKSKFAPNDSSFLENYVLALPKHRHKRNSLKQSSGIDISIDQLFNPTQHQHIQLSTISKEINNIPTNSVNIYHKQKIIQQQQQQQPTPQPSPQQKGNNQTKLSSNTKSNSSGQLTSPPPLTTTIIQDKEKKFIILETKKKLSSYNLSNQEIIYLKSPRFIKLAKICFELITIDQKSKCIYLELDLNCKIETIYEKLAPNLQQPQQSSLRVSKNIQETHFLYVPKNAERGIVLDGERSLREYHIVPNDTIQLKPFPTYKSFSEKFRVNYDRSQKNLLYELVQSCMIHALPSSLNMMMSSSIIYDERNNPDQFLKYFRQQCSIDDLEEKIITKNVINNNFHDQGLLIELKERLELLANHNHSSSTYSGTSTSDYPYSVEAFGGSVEQYLAWRNTASHQIAHMMRSIIFREDYFHADLFVSILQVDGLDSTDSENMYCIISNSVSHKIKSTLSNQNQWNNQSFYLKQKKPRGKLDIYLMRYEPDQPHDRLLGKIEISLKDLEDCQLKDSWYSLPSRGRIHLQLEYHYQFYKYQLFLNNILEKIEKDNIKQKRNVDPKEEEEDEEEKEEFENAVKKVICPTNHVVMYKQLLASITQYCTTVVGGSWTNNSLARYLLNQYSVRFGVCKSSVTVMHLEELTQKYDPSSINDMLELEELTSTINTIFEVKIEYFTLIESTALKSILSTIYNKMNYSIGRYYETFPNNQPRGCLDSLVKSFENIITTFNRFLPDGNGKRKFAVVVSQCIQDESRRKFKENVQEMGFMSLDVKSKIKDAPEITKMLIELLSIIQDEINNTLVYESAFPTMDIKITCDVIDAWGKCIVEIIEDFCSWAPFNKYILPLVKKLLDYYDMTKKLSAERFKPLPLKQLFITYVYKLLKEIKSNLNSTITVSIKNDDKKTQMSLTKGYSSSYVQFYSACDNAIKDFDSLLWLPDAFSYVQLLELMSSEIVRYATTIEQEFEHFISHTEIEDATGSKPNIFILNAEPCLMINNIDATKGRLELYFTRITESLSKHFTRELATASPTPSSPNDETTRQCVESSLQLCYQDSLSIVNSLFDKSLDFLSIRIKVYIFHCFQDVLFSDALLQFIQLSNDQIQQQQQQQQEIEQQPQLQTSGTNSPFYDPVSTTAAINSANAASAIIINNVIMNRTKENIKFEKAILTPIKEFICPMIEQLFGKLKDTIFKLFVKKLWIETMDELFYLVVPRTIESKKSYHVDRKVTTVDQINIIHSCIKEMSTIFHRGGSGCPSPILDEKAAPFKSLLQLSIKDTTYLIDIYKIKENQQAKLKGSMTSSSSSSSSSAVHSSITVEHILGVISTRTEEKEARVFYNKIMGIIDPEEQATNTEMVEEVINVVPESEFIIDKYTCSYNGQIGVLVISSRCKNWWKDFFAIG
ncbi:hypothetical protein DFA_10826 [Cavenderia fasciculata]|uniref:Uncharacterized protein n=1 Tax=Cavenderia fasciculata TaxID=261658 RepID=F4QBI0_CACFS|nr:uncharacterized protein DFA_10826 [Cavenderia fasciculata]EGG14952.1 hypothetical protein DFA_10826 [Cavenderia fasciculata]|eukprot:XP_004351468.1 hypothetical protein DFA_10826 [Cavenderia fasciculata]